MFQIAIERLRRRSEERWIKNMKIVLASQSPRRKELLGRIYPEFEIMVSEANERLPKSVHPQKGVEILARRKGEAVLSMTDPCDVIISSDTLVELNGKALGKPHDEDDAVKMLMSLSQSDIDRAMRSLDKTKAEKIASRVFLCRLSISASIQILKNVPYRTNNGSCMLYKSIISHIIMDNKCSNEQGVR